MRKIKSLKILALGLLFVSSTVFSQIRYQASMDPGAKSFGQIRETSLAVRSFLTFLPMVMPIL